MATDFTESFREFFQQIIEESVRKVFDEKRQEEIDRNPYFTRKEAAQRLGVSVATFYRLRKLNPHSFAAVKIGNKVLYTKESVEKFAAKAEEHSNSNYKNF